MLSGVHDQGLGPGCPFQCMVKGGDLHEVGPRSGYEMDDFHPVRIFPQYMGTQAVMKDGPTFQDQKT
jgi:hypothetical protein